MMLALDMIRIDGGTQPRELTLPGVVDDYAEEMRGGTTFPPVVVFYDGENYWLADGFHRRSAAMLAGLAEIDATIHQGTRDDAVWFSCGANATHGLRRSREDKQRAVMTALRHEKSRSLSDRQIAAHCGVSHQTVGRIRAEAEGRSGPMDHCDQRVQSDGTTRDYSSRREAARERAAQRTAEPAPVEDTAADDRAVQQYHEQAAERFDRYCDTNDDSAEIRDHEPTPRRNPFFIELRATRQLTTDAAMVVEGAQPASVGIERTRRGARLVVIYDLTDDQLDELNS